MITIVILSGLLGYIGHHYYLLISELNEAQMKLIRSEYENLLFRDSIAILEQRVNSLLRGLDSIQKRLEKERMRFEKCIRDTVAAMGHEIRGLELMRRQQLARLRDSLLLVVRDTLEAERARYLSGREAFSVLSAQWGEEIGQSTPPETEEGDGKRFMKLSLLIANMVIVVTILAAAIQGLARRRKRWCF